MPKHFIAIAGNIGAGKSTLVTRLSERMSWKAYFEPVAENPYLEDFYRDMSKWAFHSQLFFLSYRMRYHGELLGVAESVIQDRSVYEDAEIFAQNLYESGYMNYRDYHTYRSLFELFISLLKPPDLIVYLRAPVSELADRIRKRGRSFESDISPEYLESLNLLYDRWISSFDLCPVITVPSARMDFSTADSYVEIISREIRRVLTGKQQVLFELEDLAWVKPEKQL